MDKDLESYSYPIFCLCFALLQLLMSLYFGETDQTKGMHNCELEEKICIILKQSKKYGMHLYENTL